jgi:hypothetical protein
LHESSVQALPSLQFMAAPLAHEPAEQASPVVQGFPSSQLAPSVLAGFEHTPVAVLQVPATWH